LGYVLFNDIKYILLIVILLFCFTVFNYLWLSLSVTFTFTNCSNFFVKYNVCYYNMYKLCFFFNHISFFWGDIEGPERQPWWTTTTTVTTAKGTPPQSVATDSGQRRRRTSSSTIRPRSPTHRRHSNSNNFYYLITSPSNTTTTCSSNRPTRSRKRPAPRCLLTTQIRPPAAVPPRLTITYRPAAGTSPRPSGRPAPCTCFSLACWQSSSSTLRSRSGSSESHSSRR